MKNKTTQYLEITPDTCFAGCVGDPVVSIPRPVLKNAMSHGAYASGDGCVTLCYRQVCAEDFEAYRALLVSLGYTLYGENVINGNTYATYCGKEQTLHLSYTPAFRRILRIVATPADEYLPPVAAPAYERVTETTFTQIGRRGAYQIASGMSYIIQLADGTFIISDGGPYDEQDMHDLYQFLTQRTPAGQKPVISLWMMSHNHSDHYRLALRFFEIYGDKVEVLACAYNFPKFEACVDSNDIQGNRPAFDAGVVGFVDGIKQHWPNATHWVMHTGQRMIFADVTVEVLYTQEDLYPVPFSWINHTSLAVRLTTEHTSVILLGDCEKSLCQQMADTFGEYLKSDILQLSHHGYNGACMDLYRYIDPEICLWATDGERHANSELQLGTKKGYEFNAFLRDDSIRRRQHYHASVTSTFPMN